MSWIQELPFSNRFEKGSRRDSATGRKHEVCLSIACLAGQEVPARQVRRSTLRQSNLMLHSTVPPTGYSCTGQADLVLSTARRASLGSDAGWSHLGGWCRPGRSGPVSGFRGPPTDSHGTEEDVTHGLDAQAEHIELLLQLSIGLLVVAQRWRDHPALRLLLAHGADTSLVNPSNSLSNLT